MKDWASNLLWHIRYRLSLWPKNVGMTEGYVCTHAICFGLASIFIPKYLNGPPLPILIPVALFSLALFFACAPCFPRKTERS